MLLRPSCFVSKLAPSQIALIMRLNERHSNNFQFVQLRSYIRKNNSSPRVLLPIMNEEIKQSTLMLVMPKKDGEETPKPQLVDRFTALSVARSLSLDLVCVAPDADPIVCRLMDYHNMIYSKKLQNRGKKSSRVSQQVKEIRMRGQIDGHDFERKMNDAAQSLQRGEKCKINVFAMSKHLKVDPMSVENVRQRIIDWTSSNNITIVEEPAPRPEQRRSFVLKKIPRTEQ